MSIVRRIQQLYEPVTKPQYRRDDMEVDSRTLLDPDVEKADLPDGMPDEEEEKPVLDLSPLESIMESYNKPDFHIHVNEPHHPEKDKIPQTKEESLLKTRNTGSELDDTLKNDDDYRPQYVPSGVIDYYEEAMAQLPITANIEPKLLRDSFDGGTPKILYPSQIPEYYNGSLNEAAMKAKQRNALDDSEFGLPRLRAYPLNDRQHVKAAIRMFNHCKDPEDQKTLAHNIFKAMKKHGVDMKIGEGNSLYKYAPEELKEAAYPKFLLQAVGKPMEKRTKEDIVKEHLRVNSDFYNNAFYGQEYANAIRELDAMEFLEVFYPNVRSMAFGNRILTTIGGSYKDGKYTPDINWFRMDLSNDRDHIDYCKKLYDVMGKMLLDERFDPRNLTPEEMGVILDWNPRVSYHYGLLQDTTNETVRRRETQYLWDLFWNYNENPNDPQVKTINTIAFVSSMRAIDAKGKTLAMNEDQIIGRQELRSYLEKELGQSDDIYLLPKTKDFPIIDQLSVRLAMDKIGAVPEKDRREFSHNLNRRYRELGCDFTITVDHPYAKYASKRIVERMTHVLMEDTSMPVDDQEANGDYKLSKMGTPFYRRTDYVPGSSWHNILDNKEMGPNNSKEQRPDYTAGEALL